MEILLGIVVFGLLGTIALYGYSHSNRASRTGRVGVDGRSDRAAMVSGSGRRDDDSPRNPET